MDYMAITFQSTPQQNELLIAFLSEESFDSFEETASGLIAYIPAEKFSSQKLDEVVEGLKESGNIFYTSSLIKDQNWNALWESNFEPVRVSNTVYVRAPFHPERSDIQYEIVIEPKMSFGTGHHATTTLMMEEMLKIDLEGESVLDMGCGSGILAILAAKKGARAILEIDVDEWAFSNAFENCARNQSQHVIVQKGDSRLLEGKAFEVILANINRNVLLRDMAAYVRALRPGGHLLVSGFLTGDEALITGEAGKLNLEMKNRSSNASWMMIHFKKPA